MSRDFGEILPLPISSSSLQSRKMSYEVLGFKKIVNHHKNIIYLSGPGLHISKPWDEMKFEILIGSVTGTFLICIRKIINTNEGKRWKGEKSFPFPPQITRKHLYAFFTKSTSFISSTISGNI